MSIKPEQDNVHGIVGVTVKPDVLLRTTSQTSSSMLVF